MRPFTEIKDISLLPPRRPLRAAAAVALITARVIRLTPEKPLNPNEISFWVEKLVLDILDYCHRDDFPDALVYTCVDLVLKRLADAEAAAENVESDTTVLPLSKIKMDDTEFDFYTGTIKSTTAPDNIGLLSDLDFDSIKPRLNIYRKLVSR